MMRFKHPVFLTIIAIVVASCTIMQNPFVNSNIVTRTPVSPNITVEGLTSVTPDPTHNEFIAPSASLRVTTTAKIPLCAHSGIQSSPSADFGIPGTIIYQERFQGLYTVGGDPLTYSKLPVSEENKYSTFGFSPDGNWFAYSPLNYDSTGELNFGTPKIVLLSADGKRIEQTLSVEQFSDELQVAHQFRGFSGYSYWINNDTLYAALYSMNPDPGTTRRINDLPKVLEPFTNVWREDLLQDLPEDASPFAKGISPDMTRMLYMDGDGLFLRDLENGVDIWHDEDLFAGYGALMFWSGDSQTVAYANLFESPEKRSVVLISRDGVANPIMTPSLPLARFDVMDLRWSPDGHYLALLGWNGEGDLLTVMIYDFDNETFVSQCPVANYTSRSPQLFWSPDNKYLAYAALDYPLVIMEVQTGEVFQLAAEGRAVGWSDEFPVIWP